MHGVHGLRCSMSRTGRTAVFTRSETQLTPGAEMGSSRNWSNGGYSRAGIYFLRFDSLRQGDESLEDECSSRRLYGPGATCEPVDAPGHVNDRIAG